MTNETVKVKAATLQLGETGEKWMDDTVRLTMTTTDGVRIEFDLDVIAVSLLALTSGPILGVLKSRAEAQDGPLGGGNFGGGDFHG